MIIHKADNMKKIWIPVLILLLAAGCASTFKQKRELSKPMVAIAMGKIQQGEIQGALVELRRAVQVNPKDPEVYYAYALAYWSTEDLDRALENIDKAVNLAGRLGLEHPGLKSEAYNLKGTILVGMGDHDAAIKAFQNAVKDELYATPEYAYYNMASVYCSQKLYPEAEQSAKEALQKNPHYAPAWKILGQSFMNQDKDAQAIEALRKGEKDVIAMRKEYLKRRNFIAGRFNEIGLDCLVPEGAFYVFPDVSGTGLTGREFALQLLNTEKVAVVPGRAFGECGTGHIRCSYATSMENLKESMIRIERFVKGLK